MSKIKQYVSLFLLLCITLTFTACGEETKQPLDKSIQEGYNMFQISADVPREYTIDILKGDDEYILNGYSSGDKALFSLVAIRNGLKSYYNNILLVQQDSLLIGMNSALSFIEVEADFLFSESVDLQDKYLMIPNGYAVLKEMFQNFKSDILPVVSSSRESLQSGRGAYDYNFKRNSEQSVDLIGKLLEKVTAVSGTVSDKIDALVKTHADTSFDNYQKIMAYLGDAVDIDTDKQVSEYALLGSITAERLKYEISSLKDVVANNEYYISEGISYSENQSPKFEYSIDVLDKKGSTYEKISVVVKNVEKTDDIDASKNPTIDVPTFINTLLSNVKNAKGVGYETDDFPYDITYTANELTVQETNDLYRGTYTFSFSGKRLTSYTVVLMTYESYIHDALNRKYSEKGYSLLDEDKDSLISKTSSGVLKFQTSSLPAKYSSANSPLDLFDIIQMNGLPE